MGKPQAAETASKIIKFLNGRGGFDHWWEGDVDDDSRQEILDGIAGVIDAVPAAAPSRPKLEIVTIGGVDEIYVNGRLVADDMDSPVVAAQRVARALGADVDETDDPSPQPYRYYVVFTVAVKRAGGFDYMPAVRWLDLPSPIEGPEDTDRLCAAFAAAHRDYPAENIRIINFTLIDGPC